MLSRSDPFRGWLCLALTPLAYLIAIFAIRLKLHRAGKSHTLLLPFVLLAQVCGQGATREASCLHRLRPPYSGRFHPFQGASLSCSFVALALQTISEHHEQQG